MIRGMTRGETIFLYRLKSCAIVAGTLSSLLAVLLLTTLPSEAHRLPRPHRADNGAIVQNIQSLEAGKPVERKLGGGEAHAYQLKLTLDQFARSTLATESLTQDLPYGTGIARSSILLSQK
jgi:hypothetical protein